MVDYPVRMGTSCYHVLHSVPPIVAHEMNLFVDEGLVERNGRRTYELLPGGLTPFYSEVTALAQSMKEQGVSVAMDVQPLTVAYLNRRGASLRIIAGWRNQQHNWVMAQPGIETLEDARGKRIGLKDFKSIRYFSLASAMLAQGFDPQNDFEWVRNVHDGALALHERNVDVAFVGRHQAPGLREEGYPALLDLKSLWPDGRPDRLIVATDDLVQEHPEWVLGFVRAMIRAYWFVRTMPDNLTYMRNLERRLRLDAFDTDERDSPFLTCGTSESCEGMPFPVDGMPTGFDEYMRQMVLLGELEQADADHLEESLRLDIPAQAFKELEARDELQADLARARAVSQKMGY